MAAGGCPRCGGWQPLHTQRKFGAHLSPPYECTTSPCIPCLPAGRAGSLRTLPEVRQTPPPNPRRAHAHGLLLAAGGTLRSLRPPALCMGSGGRLTHGANTCPIHFADKCIAVRTEPLCSYAGGARPLALRTVRRIPPLFHIGTQAVNIRPPVGGLAIASARKLHIWRAGMRGTHSAKKVLGRSPSPFTSDRVAGCRATHPASRAAGAEARGHRSAASLPPRTRDVRARLPRGRR